MQDEADTRRLRLIKNSLYGLISWAFPIVPSLIATPIVLTGLGSESFGIYVLVLAFTSYFLTYGIGKIATKYIAEYRSTGEEAKISEILSATILLTLCLSIGGTILLGIFARSIVVDVLLIAPEMIETAVTALYVACSIILIGSMSSIFQYVLQGLQRFDRYMLLANLSSILLAAGNILVVYLGYGVVGIFLCNLAVTTFISILAYAFIRKLLPDFKFTFRFGAASWNAVWRYALGIMGYQLFGNVLFLFERTWITRQLGSETLTYYAVPMALAMYIHLFTGNLVSAMFPVVNELLDDKVRLRNLYNKATKIILAFAAFAVASGLIGGRLFLGQWLGEEFAVRAHTILSIHIFTFGILAANPIVWQISEGFRRASINSFATFFWMAVSIPLMIALSSSNGAEGIAIGRLVGSFIFIPLVFFIESRYVGGISWSFWGSVAFRIIPSVAIAGAVEWLLLYSFEASWAILLAAILSGIVVYMAALALSGFFTRDERELLSRYIAGTHN